MINQTGNLGGKEAVVDAILEQLGYEQITVLSSSTGLTVPTGARSALIQTEGVIVRYRPDGSTTAPTASVGMRILANAELFYTGPLDTIRFIEVAINAILNITYYK